MRTQSVLSARAGKVGPAYPWGTHAARGWLHGGEQPGHSSQNSAWGRGGCLVPPWGTLDIACGGGKSEPGDAGQDSGTRTTSCHGSSVAGEDYRQAMSTDSCKLCQVLRTGQLLPRLQETQCPPPLPLQEGS